MSSFAGSTRAWITALCSALLLMGLASCADCGGSPTDTDGNTSGGDGSRTEVLAEGVGDGPGVDSPIPDRREPGTTLDGSEPDAAGATDAEPQDQEREGQGSDSGGTTEGNQQDAGREGVPGDGPVVEPTCLEGQERRHTCPDGSEVPWCKCENGRWACVADPSIACKTPVCTGHCDCPQGMMCAAGGLCVAGKAPVYCCDRKGCPSGQPCYHRDGSQGTCGKAQVCKTATDCTGPLTAPCPGAHWACENGACVQKCGTPTTCDARQVAALAEKDRIAGCSKSAECRLEDYGICPFGCLIVHNRNRSAAAFKKLVDAYVKAGCPVCAYKCQNS